MDILTTLKKLWADLYENKPLFYAVLVIVALALYFWWQNQQQQLTMPSSAGSMPLIPTGTVPEGPPIVQQPPTTSGGIPPGDLFPPGTHPGPGGPGVANPPPSSIRTVTVTPWPTQTSTLWGIAQKFYGNGQQWQKIYAANKAKIGPNPNVIHAGTVLVVP